MQLYPTIGYAHTIYTRLDGHVLGHVQVGSLHNLCFPCELVPCALVLCALVPCELVPEGVWPPARPLLVTGEVTMG